MKPLKGASNSTTYRQAMPYEYLVAMIVLKSTCILLGIAGNVLVIIHNVVLRHEKNTATYLCINLAISDLLACVAIFSPRIGRLIHILTGSQNEVKKDLFCKVLYFSGCYTVSLSVLTLVAVMFDRYLFIKRPLKYPLLMTMPKVRVIIIATWLATSVYLTLTLIYSIGKGNQDCHVVTIPLSIMTICYVYVPIFAIFLLNFKTWRIAHAQRRFMARNLVRDASAKNCNLATKIAKEIKAVKTFAIVIGMLLFCFTPYAVLVVFDMLREESPSIPPWLDELFTDLVGLNSVCNPLIYSLRHREYRKAIRTCFSSLGC